MIHHTHPSKLKIIVGLSGGVDSSVSALLLKQQGYQVEGLFMKNWEEDDTDEYCSASKDVADAQAVCDQLDIPLHRVNFAAEYWDNVFEHFLQEYRAGRTPNPDILCNKEIKFKAFLEYAKHLGADYIATGHYARIFKPQGTLGSEGAQGIKLLTGLDSNKDQTYFLYTLGQAQLASTLFPVGALTKPEVRKIAAENNFINSTKKDSTGICFIGEKRFKEFLARYLPAEPGDMETPEGQCIGQHDGLMYYTLGQRQGLKIGGLKNNPEAAWYVVDKDVKRNVLLVAQGHHHPLLYKKQLTATQLHWVAGQAPADDFTCSAKIRYRQQAAACKVFRCRDVTCNASSRSKVGTIYGDDWHVEFAEAQWAITPGQSIVFYQGEACLGGGIIN